MAATTLLSDNGASSGLSGYTLVGGTDGTLEIKTTTAGGTPTTAMSINNSQVVTFANQPVGITAFPSGTSMLFAQTSAPTGWTKSTAHNNKALRVVSGTAGSGGTVAFTTAFSSQGVSGTVGDTTLSSSQIPSHTHSGTTADPNSSLTGGFAFTDDNTTTMAVRVRDADGIFSAQSANLSYVNSSSIPSAQNYNYRVNINATHTHNFTTGETGGGGSHTHSFTGSAINLAVQYVDVIIATKD